jgi:ribosomal protein L7Ae-like RNA K-turn-binding protein
MANNQRLLGMLGFAMRAGKLIVGSELVCRAMPRRDTGRIVLVVIASNVSDATAKRLKTKSEFYGIRSVTIDMTTDELGAHLGKTYTPACVGVCDEGFAKEIEKAVSSAAT